MKLKIVPVLIVCIMVIGCATAAPVSDSGNYVLNGDFSKFGSEWPNLPYNWRTTWKGGDGYEPIKTEDGRFIGWAENIYSFTLFQSISNLVPGTYTLSAEFRLNPDSVVEDIVMNVYSGAALVKSKSVRDELFSVPRETDVLFELGGIEITGRTVKIEFAGTNILKYIGIDNVVFSK
jgi:hypothetical protein